MIKQIRNIIDEQMQAYGLSELKIGTVISTSPLKIKISDRITLSQEQLLLTEEVLEKKIKLIHKHNAQTGTFVVKQQTESDSLHLVKGNTENELHPFCIIQEGLKVNDKVIIISAEKNQKFIVLSKVREKKSVLIDGITSEWSWS